jgi:hypothetical protein
MQVALYSKPSTSNILVIAVRKRSAVSIALCTACTPESDKAGSTTTNSSPPTRASVSFFAEQRLQPLHDLQQQCVAGRMSAGIIDQLEIIQIEIQHSTEQTSNA